MSAEPQPSGFALPGPSPADGGLRGRYRQEFERARRDFEATGCGLTSLSQRSRLVDSLILTLWDQQFSSPAISGCALLAVGGYGRSELFPHSDVDLLFLAGDEASRDAIKVPVRSVCQRMWDAGLRVSPFTRTIGDCARLNQENVEFTLSLLDCRFLVGDAGMFEQLHRKRLPELIAREADALLESISEMTAARHRRFGNTIFHLEPNLKDGPGGLRDCHVAQWMGMIFALTSGRRESDADGKDLARVAVLEARNFLSSARCHLHYRHNRDDNNITWDAQEELALRGVGTGSGTVSPSEWMRLYFRHAKAVYSDSSHVLGEVSQRRSSLYRSFQRWRSRVSNSDFSVVNGRVYFQQSADAREAAAVLRLFVFLAKHGVALSSDAECRIRSAQLRLSETMPQGQFLWQHLREILVSPHAAEALRAMHSLGLLTQAVPEFEAIHLLVLRDLYHRYTVDEHTLLAIEVLHQLGSSPDKFLQPFAELLAEVERPELLFLALLLHDVGKGLEGSDHVHGSLQLAQAAVERMQLPQEDATTVCFLVGAHLEMSSTMRSRDIYEPATVAELAQRVATSERLKMLTLLTLADIKAVNPQALTPWKAENLWRLYTATASHFDRSADAAPVDPEASADALENVIALQPERRGEILKFLHGLPLRYLLAHSGRQVIEHFEMSTRLAGTPVQLQLLPGPLYELTVVTGDRSGLFCTLAGILDGWGMDITKAAAFSNRDGVAVDSFYFNDRFRTLDLNPTERTRFRRSITEILMREAPLEKLLESRARAKQPPVKLTVQTKLRHDNECSARNTLLEVVTQDRPGLLHTISSVLTEEGCSIEVALIDTEGPLAHDVFYLTRAGRKLTEEEARELEWSLGGELSDSLSGW